MFKFVSAALIAIMAAAPVATAQETSTNTSTQFFTFNNIGNNYISFQARNQDQRGRAELGTVRTDGPGVVEVYTYHAGRVGHLLASTSVHAGANSRVRLTFRRTRLNAIAILKVGGQIVDTQRLDYRR